MALFKKNSEPKAQKNCLAIPENMYAAPFEDIIACMDPQYLKDAVIFDFAKLLPYRSLRDYRFFRMYPEWENLFSEHLEEILCEFTHVGDFHVIVKLFPEHATEIYEFLLEQYLLTSDTWISENISVIDDILIPMADLERYQYGKFDIVRNRCLEILDATNSYAELWEILQIFDQYFDMPRDYFNEYLQNEFKEFVDSYMENGMDYPVDDYEALAEFFMDCEAYQFFMDNLPELMEECGIMLYAILIQLLGSNKEVIQLHDCCKELYPE